MTTNTNIVKIDTIADYNRFVGVESQHPQATLISFEQAQKGNYYPKQFGIFVVACYWDSTSPNQHCNDREAQLIFYSPGQYECHLDNTPELSSGWILTFDGELMKNTLLYGRLLDYPFFCSTSNNILTLNSAERRLIVNCMQSIHEEINTPVDRFTTHIIAAGIGVLLNLSMRYYERQYTTINSSSRTIINKFNQLLSEYIHRSPSEDKHLPTVASCARQLGISPNYLGDVVRNTLRQSAQAYIHHFIINEVKHQLHYSNQSISQISYNLGFKYPHHLTRLFRKETGMTPREYKAHINSKVDPTT